MVDPAKLVIQNELAGPRRTDLAGFQSAELARSRPADPNVPLPGGRPCSQCGFPYDINSPFCPACGHPGTHRTPLAPSDPNAAQPERRTLECRNCGSQVVVADDQRSYTCPFCESNVVVELPSARTGRSNPDFVIGFAVTPQAAAETFRRWIRDNHWFRPGDLPTAQIESRLRGVYLPFWAFSSLAESTWNSQIGEYWYRTETYTVTDRDGKTETRTRTVRETEWWPLAGHHHRYYAGFLVSASHGLSQADAEAIKPFHLAACQRFQAYFLAGWACEEYSVTREQASSTAQEYFLTQEHRAIQEFLPGDTQTDLHVDTQLHSVDCDLALLPVYILSYQYQKRSYRFLINGQTGRIVGDKPLSPWRIGFFVLLIGLLLLLLFFLSQSLPHN